VFPPNPPSSLHQNALRCGREDSMDQRRKYPEFSGGPEVGSGPPTGALPDFDNHILRVLIWNPFHMARGLDGDFQGQLGAGMSRASLG